MQRIASSVVRRVALSSKKRVAVNSASNARIITSWKCMYTTEAAAAPAKTHFRPGSPEDPWGQGNVTIHSWNRQLLDLIEAGKHDEAKALYNKMESGQGPKPNIPTFHIMMNLYRKLFDYNTVAELDKKLHDSLIARKSAGTRIRGVPTRNISRPYRPKYRTGSWALLVALFRANNEHGLNKQELIDAATPLCDTSFTEPTDYNGFYSSWASMTTLKNKKLVEVSRGGDAAGSRYTLTEDGKHMAAELDAEARDPTSSVIHAMDAKQQAADAAKAGAVEWFSADLNERLASKLGAAPELIEKIRSSVNSVIPAAEPPRKKQLAAVLLVLHAKEGNTGLDNAVKKSKNPADVADVIQLLKQHGLLSQ